jgi:hypothetical protein
VRGQEPNGMPEGLQLAGPIVSRPAGLEHDRRGWPLCEECEESIAGQSSFFVEMTRPMRYGNLKHRLCEIDGDGRMLHMDSCPRLSQGRTPIGTMMPHGRRSPFHRLPPTAARRDHEAAAAEAEKLSID